METEDEILWFLGLYPKLALSPLVSMVAFTTQEGSAGGSIVSTNYISSGLVLVLLCNVAL